MGIAEIVLQGEARTQELMKEILDALGYSFEPGESWREAAHEFCASEYGWDLQQCRNLTARKLYSYFGKTLDRRLGAQNPPRVPEATEQLTPDAAEKNPAHRPRHRDSDEDRRIAAAWESKRYRKYAELASELHLSKKQVKDAIDNDRKRKKLLSE